MVYEGSLNYRFTVWLEHSQIWFIPQIKFYRRSTETCSNQRPRQSATQSEQDSQGFRMPMKGWLFLVSSELYKQTLSDPEDVLRGLIYQHGGGRYTAWLGGKRRARCPTGTSCARLDSIEWTDGHTTGTAGFSTGPRELDGYYLPQYGLVKLLLGCWTRHSITKSSEEFNNVCIWLSLHIRIPS